MRLLIIVWITFTLLLATPGCTHSVADETQPKVPGIADRLVFEPIRPGQDQELITLPAQVRPNPRNQFELSSPASGKVVALLVREGEWVDAQTPLARLQIPSMTAWDDIEKAARQMLKTAGNRSKMEAEKLELGISTRDGVQAAAAEEAAARMELSRIRASRKAVNASGLHSDGLSDLSFTWRSPKTGVITRVLLSEGQSVTTETVAFSMVDTAGVEVVVQLPERLLDQVGDAPRLLWRPTGFSHERDAYVLDFSRVPIRRPPFQPGVAGFRIPP